MLVLPVAPVVFGHALLKNSHAAVCSLCLVVYLIELISDVFVVLFTHGYLRSFVGILALSGRSLLG